MRAILLSLAFGMLALGACESAPEAEEPVVISLSRGPCFGTCAIYVVTINGDGSAVYEGKRFVAVTGRQEYRVPAADVAALVAKFKAANFFSLKDQYRANVTDLPTYVISLTLGERTKTVTDYAGLMVGMPKAVADLEAEVDRVGQTARFVKGN